MKSPTGKTARFKEVVERCGTPEPYTAWLDPKRDRRFQEAWRENRILSVKQHTDGRKDVGEVGYVREPGTSYFIFAKTLNPFAGKRIVGIQYDLVAAPQPRGRTAAPVRHVKRPKAPAPKQYEVIVRVTAVVHLTETVEAESLQEAESIALKNAEFRDVNLSDAKVLRRVIKAKKA